jgi:polysaccharide deacetylase 2 family uncharacterized protein YibQ
VTRLLPLIAILFWAPLAGADQRPILSLVIDDLGYSWSRGKAALNLTGNHTYAIIPGTAYGKKLAALADENGKEIILHLPLQASNFRSASESNTLTESMSEAQITFNTATMLSEFPNIKGINNHMGSHLTEISRFMRPIMESIKAYRSQLYFLDSRTSSRSVAYIEALNSGLDSVNRDIFLDTEHTNLESIKFQFELWLKKARDTGSAVAIGHPHPSTMAFLAEKLPSLEKDFQLMPISQLISAIRKSKAEEETIMQQYLSKLQ